MSRPQQRNFPPMDRPQKLDALQPDEVVDMLHSADTGPTGNQEEDGGSGAESEEEVGQPPIPRK